MDTNPDIVSELLLKERVILIVDDEEDTLDACSQILAKSGCRVNTTTRAVEALSLVKEKVYDVVVADLKMPQMDGLELLKAIKNIDPLIEVIMITGYATVETAVEAMKAGAYDYILKPFTPEELRLQVKKAIEKRELFSENTALKERLKAGFSQLELIGASPPFLKMIELVDKVAPTNATVLVYGETGTGKELVARRIHNHSHRADKPLIVVQCAAIPSELLESELFGHERGAFTGAVRRKKGSFELAHGSTLFLDEIGEMSFDLQVKLLRALQEKEIKPIGGERKQTVDVRVVAATNKDLRQAVRTGEFREDLFFRLNVVPIYVPALRERKSDIPLLAQHFLKQAQNKFNKPRKQFSPTVMELMMNYRWPGNVRELENMIERVFIMEDLPTISIESFRQMMMEPPLPQEITARPTPGEPALGAPVVVGEDLNSLPTLEKVERDYILEVLQATKWNKKKASEILGISTVTLWRKIERSGNKA